MNIVTRSHKVLGELDCFSYRRHWIGFILSFVIEGATATSRVVKAVKGTG
jgi:hypothetical protein